MIEVLDEDKWRERADLYGVPANLREELAAYFVRRQVPSAFISSVLRNDLRGAAVAITEEPFALTYIVRFLCANAPPSSWGSERNYDCWLNGNKWLVGGKL
jgi:hypothetical protein